MFPCFWLSPITFPNLGITVDLSPVAFTVFGKDIYWYGIIIASGFLLAVLYMLHRAKDFGVTQDDVLDMILWAVPIGVVCARLYYCIFYWELYEDDPISMPLYLGGRTCHLRRHHRRRHHAARRRRSRRSPRPSCSIWRAWRVIIGQCIGRWGNFMNREAHGAVTEAFLKMGLQDAAGVVTSITRRSSMNSVEPHRLHRPASVLEKRKFDGEVFLLYVAWYGLGRAWIEGLAHRQPVSVLHGHPREPVGRHRPFLAAAGILAWVLLKRSPRRTRSMSTGSPQSLRRLDGKDTDD